MEKYILRLKFDYKLGFLDITKEEFSNMLRNSPVGQRPHKNSDQIKNTVIKEIVSGNVHFEDFFPYVELQVENEILQSISYVDIVLEVESFPFIDDLEQHRFRLYKKALTVLNNTDCTLVLQEKVGEGEMFSFETKKTATHEKMLCDDFGKNLELDIFTIVATGEFKIFESQDSAEATERILNALQSPQAYVESKKKHIGLPGDENFKLPLAQPESPVYIIELFALENSFVGRGIPLFSGTDYLGRTHSIPTLDRIYKTLKESAGLLVYYIEASANQKAPYNYIRALYMDETAVGQDIL